MHNSTAINVLRIEYYRILSDERSITEEMWLVGGDGIADRLRKERFELLDCILVLGGSLTREESAFADDVLAKRRA